MKKRAFPMVGYVLLPASREPHYRGIDRNPFEPEIIEEQLSTHPGPSGLAYTLLPTGWRRDAYHLFEDGLAPYSDHDVYMIKRLETATVLAALVSEHLGYHEVMRCSIWPVGDLRAEQEGASTGFQGYDVAYLGGDHYSALLNGLVVTPHLQLVNEFGGLLNQSCLFPSVTGIGRFEARFKELVPSESSSEFFVHAMTVPG